MSIVLAVRKDGLIALGSDSLSVFGSHREDQSNIVNNQKIIQIGSSYLRYTGWGIYGNILTHYLKKMKTPPKLNDELSIFSFFLKFTKDLREKYNFVNEQSNSEKDPFSDLDSCFIIANQSGIFGISSNLSVCQYRTFHAIGSGCDYAFGALHAVHDSDLSAEQLARVGVEAAIKFDSDCGGEIVIKKVIAGQKKTPSVEARQVKSGPKVTASRKVVRGGQ